MTYTRTEHLTALLTDGLATYRVVKLIRDDKIATPLRDAIASRYGEPEDSKVAYLADCPWCMSVWFGLGFTLLRRRWPRATSVVSRGLALSAMTGLAAEHLG